MRSFFMVVALFSLTAFLALACSNTADPTAPTGIAGGSAVVAGGTQTLDSLDDSSSDDSSDDSSDNSSDDDTQAACPCAADYAQVDFTDAPTPIRCSNGDVTTLRGTSLSAGNPKSKTAFRLLSVSTRKTTKLIECTALDRTPPGFRDHQGPPDRRRR